MGNIEVKEKQNSLFLTGQSLSVLLCLCLMLAGTQVYSGFKEHDLIMCKSKIHVVVPYGVSEF